MPVNVINHERSMESMMELLSNRQQFIQNSKILLTAASVRSFKLPRFHMTHFPHVQAVRGYAVILLDSFVRFSLSEKF